MTVDQATSQLLTELGKSGVKPIAEMTPAEARGLGASLEQMSGPGPEVQSSTDHQVKAWDGGKFGVRVLAMPDPRGVIVYYHGGGWVMGTLDESDNLGRQLANRTGCTVVLVDYRLAPEHRYPTAAEDAWAALRWAVAQHLAAGPLIVAGDSAGGNLAAIVAQRAKAENGPAVTLQVLAYPVTDCDTENDSYTDPENQLLLDRNAMLWYWDHYAPNVEDRKNPDASPLRAGDLHGLPPAIVITAEHDPLRQEGEAYAARLKQSGVPVDAKRFAGQMHGFFTMVNILPAQAESLDYVVERIDRALRV